MKYLHLNSHSYKIECGISNTVIIGMNILFDKYNWDIANMISAHGYICDSRNVFLSSYIDMIVDRIHIFSGLSYH